MKGCYPSHEGQQGADAAQSVTNNYRTQWHGRQCMTKLHRHCPVEQLLTSYSIVSQEKMLLMKESIILTGKYLVDCSNI